jgi:hypothetical protein
MLFGALISRTAVAGGSSTDAASVAAISSAWNQQLAELLNSSEPHRNAWIAGKPQAATDLLKEIQGVAHGQDGAIAHLLIGDGTGLLRAYEDFTNRVKALRQHGYSEFHPFVESLSKANQQVQSTKSETRPQKWERVYIPTIRGLRPLSGSENVYQARTLQDYKFDSQSGHVHTGLDMYTSIQSAMQGDYNQRRSLEEYQAFLGSKFFGSQRVELIPRIKQDVLHIRIGDEAERPVYELGDGIQHVIILTWPMFLYRHFPLLLYVEEPELFLHHGFQRLLIESFVDAPSTEPRQVFVATHSHQFLDLTLDHRSISIFSFAKNLPADNAIEKVPRFSIRRAPSDPFGVLEQLGVRNSSVLLSNCTIWVEGITDRKYFRHYISLYQDSLRQSSATAPFVEDLHYAFVEYSGANIAHWSFLDIENGTRPDRLCGKLLLIVDDDGASIGLNKSKSERHAALRDALGDRLVLLPCREVENLLSPDTIKQVVASYEEWNDSDLARLLPFSQDDYQHKYLGDFIEKHLAKSSIASRRRSKHGRPYSLESGTIRDKALFADRALDQIVSWDDVSSDAKMITTRIYNFIQSNNV